jgi:hypothetical protein
VLLAELTSEHHSIELRRIIVATKGQRLGRRALSLVLDRAFGTLAVNRVWLDVKVHNQRARRAYAAVGFIDEGVLRDALLNNGAYESLAVMSILDDEWINRRNRAQKSQARASQLQTPTELRDGSTSRRARATRGAALVRAHAHRSPRRRRR